MINNKIYIGQSNRPRIRWYQHKKESKKDNPSMVINKAMKKYGIDNFTFEVIASILPVENGNEYCKIADECEEYFIQEYQSHILLGKGYNVSKGGSTSPKTDAWKAKMSEKVSALWSNGVYNEVDCGMRGGKTHSEEAKEKIGLAKKGKPSPRKGTGKPKVVKVKQPRVYQPMSEEAKEKNRIAHLGKHHSRETEFTSEKVMGDKNPFYGKTHSEEAKDKNRLAHLGKSPGNKTQLSEEQIEAIKQDTRGLRLISKHYHISYGRIKQIKGKL